MIIKFYLKITGSDSSNVPSIGQNTAPHAFLKALFLQWIFTTHGVSRGQPTNPQGVIESTCLACERLWVGSEVLQRYRDREITRVGGRARGSHELM